MDQDFSERLRGFEQVWRRVQKHNALQPGCTHCPGNCGRTPQARGKNQCSRARRFDPGRR